MHNWPFTLRLGVLTQMGARESVQTSGAPSAENIRNNDEEVQSPEQQRSRKDSPKIKHIKGGILGALKKPKVGQNEGRGRRHRLAVDTEAGNPEGTIDKSPLSSPVRIRRQQLKALEDARPTLTPKQVDLICTTWKVLKDDLENVGTDMLVRTFERYPDVKGAFGPFRSLSPEDQRYSQELRAHGLRVLGTVEAVVANAENPDKVVTHMHDLGRKHITFNAKVDYMDILGQQFLFAIEPVLQDHWTAAVEQAWADLFRYMTHLMKEAMML